MFFHIVLEKIYVWLWFERTIRARTSTLNLIAPLKNHFPLAISLAQLLLFAWLVWGICTSRLRQATFNSRQATMASWAFYILGVLQAGSWNSSVLYCCDLWATSVHCATSKHQAIYEPLKSTMSMLRRAVDISNKQADTRQLRSERYVVWWRRVAFSCVLEALLIQLASGSSSGLRSRMLCANSKYRPAKEKILSLCVARTSQTGPGHD